MDDHSEQSSVDLFGAEHLGTAGANGVSTATFRSAGAGIVTTMMQRTAVPVPLTFPPPLPTLPPKAIESATPARVVTQGVKLIAPMPGVVTICEKAVGEEVQEGDVVLILEAMKMENVISAPVSGKVLSILCSEGQRVVKGAVLAMVG